MNTVYLWFAGLLATIAIVELACYLMALCVLWKRPTKDHPDGLSFIEFTKMYATYPFDEDDDECKLSIVAYIAIFVSCAYTLITLMIMILH